MGDVVNSVSSLFGVEGASGVTPNQFQPFDVQSTLGSFTTEGQNVNAQLSPELQQLYSGLLGQIPGQMQQAQSPQAALSFLSGQFAPQFQRQQASQESRLFNQGLLGSTTGQLQTQGLREAQNQALVNSALQAQNQAFQRSQGLLGSALQIGQQPLSLAGIGGEFGSQQLDASIANQSARQQADARQQEFFGDLVSGTASFFSDIRLKNNVTPIGNGLYSWEWNDKAKEIGADAYPTTGVIAQEIMEVYPEAVFEGKHGYLMVDYSKVA